MTPIVCRYAKIERERERAPLSPLNGVRQCTHNKDPNALIVGCIDDHVHEKYDVCSKTHLQ